MSNNETLHIFGEVLFDHFPDGSRVLGGAPFNVAWHLQAFGESPRFISRIGNDPAGLEIAALMDAQSMNREALQIDGEYPTGSNMLDKLAKKGLIMRERVSQDQRVVTVMLTLDGIELLKQVPSPPQGILQHTLFDLPENVLKPLAHNLDVLVKQMKVKDDEAAMQPINPIPEKSPSLKKKL